MIVWYLLEGRGVRHRTPRALPKAKKVRDQDHRTGDIYVLAVRKGVSLFGNIHTFQRLELTGLMVLIAYSVSVVFHRPPVYKGVISRARPRGRGVPHRPPRAL